MIFIDTGAFVAKYIAEDQFHKKALPLWEKISQQFSKIYTSNFVIDETLTLLSRKTSPSFAIEKGRIMYSSSALTILRPGLDDEILALNTLHKFSDQNLSFTDAISFVLMKQSKIKKVFTFDSDFKRAGFAIFE